MFDNAYYSIPAITRREWEDQAVHAFRKGIKISTLSQNVQRAFENLMEKQK